MTVYAGILGVCGAAGSGKDTVADMLVQDHQFTKISFADPLKRICAQVFDFTDDQLWGPSESRNAPDPRYRRPVQYPVGRTEWREKLDEGLTPREALQLLGTEWGRKCYPPIWVELALRTAKTLLASKGALRYDRRDGLKSHIVGSTRCQGVVIADVRFKNEVDSILQAGGRVVRVKRPGAGLKGAAAAHASETEMQGIPDACFSLILENTGTLEELREKVGQLHTDLSL